MPCHIGVSACILPLQLRERCSSSAGSVCLPRSLSACLFVCWFTSRICRMISSALLIWIASARLLVVRCEGGRSDRVNSRKRQQRFADEWAGWRAQAAASEPNNDEGNTGRGRQAAEPEVTNFVVIVV